MFENRVLRKIFGPKKDEITGEWRRTQRAALFSVLLTQHYSGDQIQKNEMGRACGTYGRQEMCIQGFGGET